jgi:hypothetical protein
LARWISPAWVNPSAARWIIEAAKVSAQRRVVLVNGDNADFVAATFIRQAYSLKPDEPYIVTEHIDDSSLPTVHVENIRGSLKEAIFNDPDLDDESFWKTW